MRDARTNHVWTDDERALVAKLCRDGFSASQIAREIGRGVSRNAIIGLIHRAGLGGGSRKNPRLTIPRKVSQRRAQPKTKTFVNAVAVAHNREARKFDLGIKVAPPKSNAPAPLLIAFLDLNHWHCRWPLGDGADMRFCGHTKVGRAYCDYHERLAYQAPAPRVRRRLAA